MENGLGYYQGKQLGFIFRHCLNTFSVDQPNNVYRVKISAPVISNNRKRITNNKRTRTFVMNNLIFRVRFNPVQISISLT